MGNDAPKHEGYEEFKDTPWITQARNIADVGGRGILDNYRNVDVFNDATRKSLEARNNAIYQRAFGDAEREYRNIMNNYMAKNYNQFGTLNATPASYRTDMYNLQAQRRLDNLAYEKAMNYETLMNNELQRRYNTLNMYRDLYGYGQIPYEVDQANWNVRNTNRDIAYQNAVADAQGSGLGSIFGQVIGSTLGGVAGSAFGPLGTVVGGSIGGAVGGMV